MIAFFKEKTSSFCIFGFDLTSNKKTREENTSCHPGSLQPTVENNFKTILEDEKLPYISKKYMVDEWWIRLLFFHFLGRHVILIESSKISGWEHVRFQGEVKANLPSAFLSPVQKMAERPLAPSCRMAKACASKVRLFFWSKATKSRKWQPFEPRPANFATKSWGKWLENPLRWGNLKNQPHIWSYIHLIVGMPFEPCVARWAVEMTDFPDVQKNVWYSCLPNERKKRKKTPNGRQSWPFENNMVLHPKNMF